MGSFSAWHWVVVALFIGIPAASWAWAVKRTTPATYGGPVGIAGWLMLLAIGQTLSPLRSFLSLFESSAMYEQVSALPGGPVAVYGEVALFVAFIALQVTVIILLYRKSRLFPRFFVYQWMAIPALFFIDALLVSAALGVGVNRIITSETIIPTLTAFLATGIWVAYVHNSVRVRNTFVR